jgi:predicted RNase H-like nuclease (RuvC/YqgF family)
MSEEERITELEDIITANDELMQKLEEENKELRKLNAELRRENAELLFCLNQWRENIRQGYVIGPSLIRLADKAIAKAEKLK